MQPAKGCGPQHILQGLLLGQPGQIAAKMLHFRLGQPPPAGFAQSQPGDLQSFGQQPVDTGLRLLDRHRSQAAMSGESPLGQRYLSSIHRRDFIVPRPDRRAQ